MTRARDLADLAGAKATRTDAVMQSVGDKWNEGMALSVLPELPADDDANYWIGDVVFVVEELA